MCMHCWEKYGKPKVWNSSTQALRDCLDNLYEFSTNLHTVIEDWNIENRFVHPSPKFTAIDNFILGAFASCTLEGRASVLAVRDGLWDPDEEAS